VNVREALDLTVDQAFDHFARERAFTRALHILRRVGLGYLKLGQPATQLSGGEAQRLKIARELSGRTGGPTLYLLDEPTVGLHYADVQRLLEVLDDLTARGDTVIAVEHKPRRHPQQRLGRGPGPGGGEAGGGWWPRARPNSSRPARSPGPGASCGRRWGGAARS